MSPSGRVLPAADFRPEPDEPEPPSRGITDISAIRTRIDDGVLNATKSLEPVSNGKHTLRLTNPHYIDPPSFTPAQQKEAILTGQTLGRRLKGTWELSDDVSGQLLDKRDQVVARVPHLTDRGVYVYRGTHYALGHQQRLRPGAYARIRDNGEAETHVATMPGEGLTHHYDLDPAKQLFKVRVGQASAPLWPLLRAMGTTPEEAKAAWGDDVFMANDRPPDPQVMQRLRAKFLRRTDGDDATLAAAVAATPLDPRVSQRTLGKPFDRLGREAILAATGKLLKLTRGEAEPDDRDELAYQAVLGPEDLFVERLKKDHAGLRKIALMKASLAGTLQRMPSGLLTPQLDHVLLRGGVGQSLEETNPLEAIDRISRVTKLGEGAIPSVDSIPDAARNIRPSQLGYVDPVRTVESLRVGADNYLASGARKGDDGQLFLQYREPKTGRKVWRSPADVIDRVVALAGSHRWAFSQRPMVQGGKLGYADKEGTDLEPGAFEHSFSPIANLVPFKANSKNQRLAMASRMFTQALPLVQGEAPLVRNALPEDHNRDYDAEAGKYAGAVHSDHDATVMSVTPDQLVLQGQDGQIHKVDLFRDSPLNRKTLLNQTPAVQPGDVVRKGQLLARSNFTDDKGHLAMGMNLRTAYIPFRGLNFEDASVISESAAKRLASEHAYKHTLQKDDRTKFGLRDYLGLFPGRFDRAIIDKLDDQGVIKPGQQVNYGDPLIVAARERDQSGGRIHKKAKPGYSDATVTWEHEDSGVVTDVIQGKNGPAVVVKAISPLKEGDKLSGRYGDKGVVSAVIPDAQMPHDSQGRPFEMLLGPDGIISRANPSQKAELALSKIAAMRGRPYRVPDFEVEDLRAFSQKELDRHGMQLEEDVTDPETGRLISGVPAGVRWMMKLHHSAEGKEQARSGGGYDANDAPSRGGFAGCLHGDTEVKAEHGRIKMSEAAKLFENGSIICLRTLDQKGEPVWGEITEVFRYVVPRDKLVRLILSNGEELIATDDHGMYACGFVKMPAKNTLGAFLVKDPDPWTD